MTNETRPSPPTPPGAMKLSLRLSRTVAPAAALPDTNRRPPSSASTVAILTSARPGEAPGLGAPAVCGPRPCAGGADGGRAASAAGRAPGVDANGFGTGAPVAAGPPAGAVAAPAAGAGAWAPAPGLASASRV